LRTSWNAVEANYRNQRSGGRVSPASKTAAKEVNNSVGLRITRARG
jgi:hypothetical protein